MSMRPVVKLVFRVTGNFEQDREAIVRHDRRRRRIHFARYSPSLYWVAAALVLWRRCWFLLRTGRPRHRRAAASLLFPALGFGSSDARLLQLKRLDRRLHTGSTLGITHAPAAS